MGVDMIKNYSKNQNLNKRIIQVKNGEGVSLLKKITLYILPPQRVFAA